ncbi:electron transport complex subunit RsxG [Uliginosibacterium sediminicola]|uniref:Ion-translocating oxidoreductase complex subunit G n=1 Tax=Uliginosibacterium sediminicola TaxID=2024550 RepID=A0ABU9Z2G8_9RHOO
MSIKSKLDEVWFQGASLGVVGLAVTAVLAVVYDLTKEAIAAAGERDTQQSLEQVLPQGFADNQLLKDTVKVTGPDGKPLTVYRARKQGAIKAALFEISGKGYAGPISLVMAIDTRGTVLGVRITHHTETPGLGDKIEVAKNRWILSFDGKSLDQPGPSHWAVKKDGGDFDQFAGATITPRGVVATVKTGLEYFAAHKPELLGEPLAMGASK